MVGKWMKGPVSSRSAEGGGGVYAMHSPATFPYTKEN